MSDEQFGAEAPRHATRPLDAPRAADDELGFVRTVAPTPVPTPGTLDDASVVDVAKPLRFATLDDLDLDLPAQRLVTGAHTLELPEQPERLGHYQLLGELGRGGMGVVYAAHDTRLDRKVAIKQLRNRHVHGGRQRLIREALAMARLSDPNVITIYEIGERGDSTFIVMEYVEGETLRGWLTRPRTQAQILTVFEAAARGLIAAHRKGLVHRDFKPDNVMIGSDGRVRVMDFGLARTNRELLVGSGKHTRPNPDPAPGPNSDKAWVQLTQTGSLLGTPAYMSPEQLLSQAAGPASDQFSFCVALHEGLHGERPFTGADLDELCSAVLHGEPHIPPESAPVSPWLRALVRRGLAPRPEQRFSSMQALLDALIEGDLAASSAAREPPTHVFVAHDGRDKREVLRLCEGLLDHGVRPWLDLWELVPGEPWREPLEQVLASAPAVIVCGQPEYAVALAARIAREPKTVYRLRLPGAKCSEAAKGREVDVALDAARWDEGVLELARLVGVESDRSPWLEREAVRARIDAETLCPYRGLEVFRERDARWMFGRREEVGALLELIRGGQTRFLTLIGASGSGKSSLLLGGLCPLLRNGALGEARDWSFAYLRPGPRPCEALARALVNLNPSGDPIEEALKLKRLRAELIEDRDTLRLVTSQRRGGRLLLVIDQFEELFTEAGLGGEQASDEALAFVSNLLAAAQDLRGVDGRLWITATLRADFVQRALEVPELSQALQGGTYFALPPMREGQIRAAIERPAMRVGYRVEPELVDTLVSAAARKSGRLPLLQHLLRELWGRRDTTRRLLTHASYADTGGLEGAIATAAERALDQLRAELAAPGVSATRRLMTRLVHLGIQNSQDTRRRVPLAQLGDEHATQRALDALIREARVLVAAEVDGREVVEIAHEALLREWTTLVAWLNADRGALRLRQELAADAARRSEASAEEYLWGQGRVEEARRVLGASTIELDGSELAFLEASERVLRRRRYRARAALVVLLTSAAAVITVVAQKNTQIRAQKDAVEAKGLELEGEKQRVLAELDTQKGLRASMLARAPGKEFEALRTAVDAASGAAPSAALSGPVFSGLASAVMSVGSGLTLRGHEGKVIALAYAPDGARIVTASLDNSVRVWDSRSGLQLSTLDGHEGNVLAVAFSPEGERLATAGADGFLRIWEVATGRELAALEHPRGLRAVAFSPDGAHLATGCKDGRARVWELESSTQLLALEHAGLVSAVAWSPRGDQLASASFDGAAQVWDANTGEAKTRFEGHGDDRLHALVWASDAQAVISAGEDGSARMWDAATGAELARFEHDDAVHALALSPDGAYLASGTYEGDAGHVWELATARKLRSFAHRGPVKSVAWSPAGDRLATASWDGTASLWVVAPSPALQLLEGHRLGVYAVAVSPDGARFATGSGDDTARLWDAQTGAPVAELRGHHHDLSALRFSPDGARLATASWDGSARLWDAQTGAFERVLDGHEGRVNQLSFSPSGELLATASADASVRIWEVHSGALVRRLAHDDSPVVDLSFSPDGEQLITVTAAQVGRLWSSATGERMTLGFEGPITAAAFAPDGQLALATTGFEVWLRDLHTGAQTQRFVGHAGPLHSLRFSQDGAELATASEDGTARIWSLASGEELSAYVHPGPVFDLAFTGNDAGLLTASGDELARVWSRESMPWVAWACTLLDDHAAHDEVTRAACEGRSRAGLEPQRAHAQPQVVESAPPRHETIIEHGVELVWVPGGSFMMGSPEGVGKGREHPQQELTLDGFYMARTELTNGQYALFVEANPDAPIPSSWDDPRHNHPQQPIVGLDWYESKAYCDWAGFRLPTEAQWEYAARAGTETLYWHGDELELLDRFVWSFDNSGGRSHFVGSLGVNDFGLADLSGSVYEWTRDAYTDYEVLARPGDGLRREAGGEVATRGGSWANLGRRTRVAYRMFSPPLEQITDLGIRPIK